VSLQRSAGVMHSGNSQKRHANPSPQVISGCYSFDVFKNV
jgi:hypothetical protein